MRRLAKVVLAGFAALLLTPLQPLGAAEPLKPGVGYDSATKFDKSFNEAVYRGVERFRLESGVQAAEILTGDKLSPEAGLRQLIKNGANFIIAPGIIFSSAVRTLAQENPNVRFNLIDSVVDLPNVRSYLFAEHEASYLAGIAAGMATRSRMVGFIGGMDSTLIRRFGCGFAQGVHQVDPTIKVLQEMIGSSPNAWNDPDAARSLARAQVSRGADVIYAAAGRSSIGALSAAADAGRLGIGVDSNQNHLFPGRVLTSMLKRVDVAAYLALRHAQAGQWQSGIVRLGLSDEGVGLAMDEHNALLITDDMHARIESAKAAILNGSVRVHDYAPDRPCPFN